MWRRIAAASDAGDVAERGVIAMAGEEAWNRLGEAAQQQRRAEGAAFVLDMVTGMTPSYDWAQLRVPCIIGYGTSWPHVKTSPQIAGPSIARQSPSTGHRTSLT